ncbi:MAG: pyruvate, phosphate dikinase, partial [Candidatus Omnitrophica bacterium]|nr:pyruvate, phosphate dikinase [Candidatus Omnitrophota bacterium]
MAKKTVKKYVYFFGKGGSEGKASMKELLGGKGANLAEMASIGVPVPPGFTISTEVCEYYYKHGKKKPGALQKQIDANVKKLEKAMGAQFGDPKNPLLVSVRSGAAVSMPGMMDTVLNLGINDDVVKGLIAKTGNERMGWDSYRRFINMFGDVCMGVDHEHFEEELSRIKKKYKRELDTDLTVDELKEVVAAYKKVYKKHVGKNFPTDPRVQLKHAVDAVIGSWNIPRAVAYRRINKLSGLKGTAVNVQAMAFGNMGSNSGTGVAFTRNPATGENKFYGEYLINAQGEDVVAGIRTPQPLATLRKKMPKIYKQLNSIRLKLEKHYKDMQDVEFTIQEGKLYMLQTRTGKRTGLAAVKMAVDMVKENLINPKTALQRIEGDHLNQLLFPIFDVKDKEAAVKANKCVAKGLPAGPGAAYGHVCFTADDAVKVARTGKKVVLVRKETSPEDVSGMWAAEAILTSTGGMTSHAAVVARGWGKCCIVGCAALDIDYSKKKIKVGNRVIKNHEMISVDGTTGEVILGKVETSASPVVLGILEGDKKAMRSPICKMFKEIMKWSDKYRKIKIRTNADTPKDASNA